MAPYIVVAHYPEGAGHATRMMAVARALEDRGATVDLVGGGPGQQFYEVNGFEPRGFTRTDYVRDFQEAPGSMRGLLRVLTESLPDSGRRLREFTGWLRSTDPDGVVTDDVFVAAAASLNGIPLYVLTHNASGLYRDFVVRSTTRMLTIGQRLAARRFFYPTVWSPHGSDPPQVSRVPPIALDAPAGTRDAGPADPGIVLVPSTYSTAFARIAARLRDAGYEVANVGNPNWEAVPALLPVLRRADAVVCAGYSTVMEASVAGTPCILYPTTNEQRGIARRLESVRGFTVVDEPDGVQGALNDPPDAPEYINGVSTVAERVLDDLR